MKKNVFLIFSLGTLFLLGAPYSLAMQEPNTEIMLLQACQEEKAEEIQSLFRALVTEVNCGQRSPNQAVIDPNQNYHSRNLLSIGVQARGTEGLKILLSNGGNPSLSETPDDDTALDWAISQGDDSIAQMFLSRLNSAADLNKLNKHGMTPLHYASWLGNVEIVSKVLNYGDIEINKKSESGHTALYYVIDSIKNLQNSEYSALHLHSETTDNHLKIAQILINHPKIDLTERDGNGRTALELAEEQGHSFNTSRSQEIAQMIRNRQRQTIITPVISDSPAPTDQNQIHTADSTTNTDQNQIKNKRSSLFAGLFRLMTSPFRFVFVGLRNIGLQAKLGTLRNYVPAKSLFSWLFLGKDK